ncbi:MAG TPA: LysE family translocator, partial [Polyangiales bacterium]
MTQDLLLIIGITLLCMLSPGPDMVLVMHSTLRGDRSAGLATSAGVLTGNLVHITYCALGVGYVVAHSVVAYSVLKLVGGLYLIFLGLASLRGAVRASTDVAAPAPSPTRSAYLR